MFFARPVLAFGLMGLFAGAAMFAGDANAQQVYRSVGPDGRVTYTDKAPVQGDAKTKAAPIAALPSAGGTAGTNLPFELRQVANRYPVTLYTGPNCAPCASGRAMLVARGVPFTEKSVTTNEDIDALKRIAGVPSLPFMSIGGQQLKGYSDAEWSQYLDAAGYPKNSILPSGYTHAAASPLVTVQSLQRTAANPAPTPAPSQPNASAEPAPPNPSGIRF
jgi:glutaredoxin